KSNKEAELAIAQQENLIKEERLKDAMLLRKIFFAGTALVILFGLALFRVLTLRKKNETLQRKQAENQLWLKQMESSRKDAEYSQQVLQLEMQALRARMNPHFIFNCLSSINWLILGDQNEAASKYLHQFSRLMRMVLENSGRSFVTLEEELNMLNLYLKMEQLRFENTFDYQIEVQDDLDINAIMVPPLLLQPFCENAIWHGLMHKGNKGMLTLKIQGRDDEVIYTIEDNGIGRANAARIQRAPDSNHRSMGTSITAERISLLNKVGGSCDIQIEDLVDAQGYPKGTRVVIKLGHIPATVNEKHFES
ncbi:MAG TPA: histidine kinase, partial [Chitinophagaceae bacterium]|nr:histidine kinase [Chitinophagaceae bacterium]